MTKGFRVAVVTLAVVAVLALAGVASAAYTTPTLYVSQAGTATTIAVEQAQTDDATARASIYAPPGIQATLNQAPGTELGKVTAQVTALALGGALLPLTGQILVAAPGQVPAASQAACTQGAAPAATWLMVLQAAGQTLNVPMYVVLTSGTEAALGSAKILVCLPPPDIPQAQGGATFGAKLFKATFTLNGVFGPSPLAPWISIWTPYQAGNGQTNAAGSVASPGVIAPGALTVALRKQGNRATLAGNASQAQQPLAAASIQVWAGKTRATLKRIATVKTGANGNYTFSTINKGPFFRTRIVLPARKAGQLCQAVGAQLPVPCVNSTVSGFTQLSRVVRR
jgi:hypothetical protein